MPGGRPNKPLFELLRDESTGRRTQPIRPSSQARPPAVPDAELKPVPQSLSPSAIDAEPDAIAEDVAPTPAGGAFLKIHGETVQISRYAALIACAVVLAVIFAIYVVAFRAGRDKALKESALSLPADSPPSAPGTLSGALRPSETIGQREPAPKVPPASVSKPDQGKASTPRPDAGFDDPTKPVLTAAGAFEADPREPGRNYLVLATLLTREDARQLVAFLGANGLETVGVPMKLESDGRPANNPGSYKVVSLKGLTSEEFKASDPLRARLKSEATRLGELWRGQNRPTIIKDTYWELLKP